MDEKMREYRETFGDQFPLMMVQGMDDAEIIKIIDACLESGKPYEPDFAEGDVY